MVKTVSVIFSLIIFILLLYRVFIPVISHDPNVDMNITVVRKKGRADTSVPKLKESNRSSITYMNPISKIVKKLIGRENNQTSVYDMIEQIGGEIGDPVYIRIFKDEAELELWMQYGKEFHLIQTYPVCAYSGELGPKLKEGDKQSPEGFYYVTKSRLNPNSKFHLSFNLGYPNQYDRAHGRSGSFLMVHGSCVSIGCYAMTDEKIEEIYELVQKALEEGQKYVRVHIFPFRMTDQKLSKYKEHKWYSFWENLKEGYDIFEEKKVPPNTTVKQKRYVFQ